MNKAIPTECSTKMIKHKQLLDTIKHLIGLLIKKRKINKMRKLNRIYASYFLYKTCKCKFT